jgi:2,5-diamino-6-(ribosylamino)-4(3H)-pyrimidinone 5'-phosphate reductase
VARVESEDPPADRPWVALNCAVSMDGRLAFAAGARARLSSPEDLRRVQRLRAEVDGIVVGVGTVVLDDPSLRVHWELLERPPGPAPARIVVDGKGRTPETARILDRSAPTIVLVSERSHRTFPSHVRTIVAGADRVDLRRAFADLRRGGLRRLLVEGGAAVLASVVRAGLFDRWTVYYAPVAIGGATAPPLLAGPEVHGFDESVRLRLAGVETLGEGFVATFVPGGPSPGAGTSGASPSAP